MTMHRSRSQRPGRGVLAALLLALPLSSCGLLETNDRRPDNARIVIEGASDIPLRLVVSQRFTATPNNETGLLDVILSSWDEDTLELPIDRTVRVETDRFLARLVNPSEADTADVRMQVIFDGRVVYDQQATLLDAQLEFIHLFH